MDAVERALSGSRDDRGTRVFLGEVTAIDGVNNTATVDGVEYKHVETPTAIAVNDLVVVVRVGRSSGIIIGRLS